MSYADASMPGRTRSEQLSWILSVNALIRYFDFLRVGDEDLPHGYHVVLEQTVPTLSPVRALFAREVHTPGPDDSQMRV